MSALSRRLLVTLTGLLLTSATFAAPVVLQVAPNGNDKAVGSAKSPFRTLGRARDAIRALQRKGPLPAGGVTVLLHDGAFRLAEPLALGPQDSGTNTAPITYAAAPGAHPVVSGGRVIKGLKRNADGSWSTLLPEAAGHKWVFRSLFVNGRRYLPARSPNTGQYAIRRGVPPESGTGTARDRFVYRGTDLQDWPNLSDVEVRLTFSWNTGTFPLKSVDPRTHLVVLGGPAVWSLPKEGMATCPYVVLNHPGACDAPGIFA